MDLVVVMFVAELDANNELFQAWLQSKRMRLALIFFEAGKKLFRLALSVVTHNVIDRHQNQSLEVRLGSS